MKRLLKSLSTLSSQLFDECVLLSLNNVILTSWYLLDSPSELLAEFQTNFFGPIYLIQSLLPSLRARRSGTIINVSSVASFDGTAGYSAYSSSKAAINAMSDILRQELAPFNVRVLTLVPGYFHTSFMTNAAALGESTRAAASTSTDSSTGKPPVTGVYPNVYGLAHKIPTMRLKIRRIGDASKAAERMYEIVTGTGLVQAMENKPDGPWHMVLLGQDAGERVKKQLMGWKQCIDQTEEFWNSTEVEPEKMEEMRREAGIFD